MRLLRWLREALYPWRNKPCPHEWAPLHNFTEGLSIWECTRCGRGKIVRERIEDAYMDGVPDLEAERER